MKRIAQYSGWLRQVRLLHWINNIAHRKQLRKNREIYRSLGIRRSVFRSIDSRVLSRHVDITDAGLVDKLPPVKDILPDPPINVNWHKALRDWSELGFVHLHRFIAGETVEAVNHGIRDGLDTGKLHFNYTGRKIFNAQRQVPKMHDIIHHPGILSMLHHFFNRPAVHFQTISFTEGSEQAAHSDSIHMTTLPLGYLAGVWVALEDIHEGNGPLTYYPGSHKLPYLLNKGYGNQSNCFMLDGQANARYESKLEEIIRENGLEEHRIRAQAGDVFIWHANLLHGGAPIRDEGATRKSMVSHYFAKGVLCYHEISERPAIIETP